MGILDLPAQLKKDKKYVIRVDREQLTDNIVGVDAFVWLHKVVYKCSNDDDFCRRFHAEPQVPFYEQLYEFLDDELRLWEELGMKVILVVDGKPNPIKSSVDVKHEESRAKQTNDLKEFLRTGECKGHKKLKGLAKDACHVSREVVGYFLQWANEKNLELVGAPMEAEHQLVFLQKNKKIDWIYTIDSDVLPLGATNVIYEVFWERGRSTLWAFTHDLVKRFFEAEVMREKNSFRLEDFVAYCVFLGCDYCDRAPGVGIAAWNNHFKKVWADKDATEKKQVLVDLEAHGKGTFDSATKGNTETVLESNPVEGYMNNFSEAYAGLNAPVVASCEAQGGWHEVYRMPYTRADWQNHLENHASLPGYEDTDIKEAFGEDMKMSNQLYTLQRWVRWPEEDFAGWLPKYPIIDGTPFEYPLVWSLPGGIRTK